MGYDDNLIEKYQPSSDGGTRSHLQCRTAWNTSRPAKSKIPYMKISEIHNGRQEPPKLSDGVLKEIYL